MIALRVKPAAAGAYKLERLQKKEGQVKLSRSSLVPKMMRIAIAGTGGLALMIAHFVNEDTSHQLVILSRSVRRVMPLFCATTPFDGGCIRCPAANSSQPRPGLVSQGYSVEVVDYGNPASLRHALMGVDTVISTVTGNAQINLIEAAVLCRVRRFAPAEFEGRPHARPANDPLDRGKSAALRRLNHHRSRIESTVFVCGIFYERFAPGGLAASRIGFGSGVSGEGDYILNIRNMTARIPAYDAYNNFVASAMTSAQDVAEFVVKSLDLDEWPSELLMSGDRVSVNDLHTLVESATGMEPGCLGYNKASF
jgi:hypothetical protein